MAGIVLAGGSGVRQQPSALGDLKQLLPVYDKPMIYYPVSVMLAPIRNLLVTTTPEDAPKFRRLIKDGARSDMSVAWAEQPYPEGLTQASTIGPEFAGIDAMALVLDRGAPSVYRRKARATEVVPRGEGAAFLRQRTARYRGRGEAVGERRARDHRRYSGLSRAATSQFTA